MPLNMKKILKHITQYWNPMQKTLQESSTVNLTKNLNNLHTKGIQAVQAEHSQCPPSLSFFAFFNYFLCYIGHTPDTLISGN